MENTSGRTRMIRVVMTDDEWMEFRVLAARGSVTLGELFTAILRGFLAERPAT